MYTDISGHDFYSHPDELKEFIELYPIGMTVKVNYFYDSPTGTIVGHTYTVPTDRRGYNDNMPDTWCLLVVEWDNPTEGLLAITIFNGFVEPYEPIRMDYQIRSE